MEDPDTPQEKKGPHTGVPQKKYRILTEGRRPPKTQIPPTPIPPVQDLAAVALESHAASLGGHDRLSRVSADTAVPDGPRASRDLNEDDPHSSRPITSASSSMTSNTDPLVKTLPF